ncbi:hypothetical protein NGRA_0869 [Nosema granulosis]|uniref:Uncharacterized protein n=1 Tax=Nosema granulosis TaxID=83296 RepID=A0A9P6KZM8_9MICR|nr:hypothetical protein NGRA_0869 [Nosema granulosis]
MNKTIFSRKYPKTKLAIITILVTIGYHYANREKSTVKPDKSTNQVKEFETTKQSQKENNLLVYDDFKQAKDTGGINEVEFDENARIIPSKWVVEYLKEVRGRSPPVYVPEAPMDLVVGNNAKVFNIHEILDCEALKKLRDLFNDEDFKKSPIKKIFWDVLDYNGLNRDLPFKALKWGAKKTCDLIKSGVVGIAHGAKDGAKYIASNVKEGAGYIRNYFGSSNEESRFSRIKKWVSSSENEDSQTSFFAKVKQTPKHLFSSIYELYSSIVSRREQENNPVENELASNNPVEKMPINTEETPIGVSAEVLGETIPLPPWYVRCYNFLMYKMNLKDEQNVNEQIVNEQNVNEEGPSRESFHTADDSSFVANDVSFHTANDSSFVENDVN